MAEHEHIANMAEPKHTSNLDHQHQPVTGLDAVNFPATTEAGPLTDEYLVRTTSGFISARGEEAALPPHAENEPRSNTTTFVEGGVNDPEKGAQDIKLVTWKIDDPEDPRNWSVPTKWVRTMAVTFACFAVAIGSSIVVMDMDVVAEDLNTSLDVIHLTVTLFVLGFGVGPLAFSPLSEMYGRQPIFFVSLGLYFAFTFPSAFAPNAASMVVGRALAGIAASAPMTVIGGTIADMWELRDRGLPMALFSGTVFIGPVIGPVIAGYLSAAGWRWNYYLLLIIVGISWVCTTIFLPETYAPVLLRHRAAKLRKETGDPTYMTEQERHKRSLSEIIKIALFRPMEMLFTEPIILFITLYLSLIYSILYIFFFAFPIIFGKLHNFSLGSVGLSFLAILIGMIGAFFTVLPYQKTLYLRSTEKADAAGHVVAPEARLPAMMIGSIALPIGLFIFAWTSYSHVHWIAPMIGGGIFGWAMISIYVGANSYVIDAFSTYAASAMAAKTFLSRVAGASIPMFVDRYYESAIGVNWASAVIAFIALIMVPIPFIFNKYGHRIRAASKKASS